MASGPRFGPGTMNAPWGLASRLKLATLACTFFDATKLAENHASIGKELPKQGNPAPLSALDFFKFLDVADAFRKTPDALKVIQFLERMASTGVLMFVGHDSRRFGGMGNHYLYVPLQSESLRGQFRGWYRCSARNSSIACARRDLCTSPAPTAMGTQLQEPDSSSTRPTS